MPQQAKQPRSLSMELKAIRRAIARIKKHPVTPARVVAIMSIETECERAFQEFAEEGFARREAA